MWIISEGMKLLGTKNHSTILNSSSFSKSDDSKQWFCRSWSVCEHRPDSRTLETGWHRACIGERESAYYHDPLLFGIIDTVIIQFHLRVHQMLIFAVLDSMFIRQPSLILGRSNNGSKFPECQQKIDSIMILLRICWLQSTSVGSRFIRCSFRRTRALWDTVLTFVVVSWIFSKNSRIYTRCLIRELVLWPFWVDGTPGNK